MRAWVIPFIVAPLIGAGFPASKYELAASFTSALVRNDLKGARKFLVPQANLHNWRGDQGSLQELAKWMQACPIKSIEGNDDININVYLDCADEWHGMSLEFTGNKIREVGFGPPPKINVVGTAGASQ